MLGTPPMESYGGNVLRAKKSDGNQFDGATSRRAILATASKNVAIRTKRERASSHYIRCECPRRESFNDSFSGELRRSCLKEKNFLFLPLTFTAETDLLTRRTFRCRETITKCRSHSRARSSSSFVAEHSSRREQRDHVRDRERNTIAGNTIPLDRRDRRSTETTFYRTFHFAASVRWPHHVLHRAA